MLVLLMVAGLRNNSTSWIRLDTGFACTIAGDPFAVTRRCIVSQSRHQDSCQPNV